MQFLLEHCFRDLMAVMQHPQADRHHGLPINVLDLFSVNPRICHLLVEQPKSILPLLGEAAQRAQQRIMADQATGPTALSLKRHLWPRPHSLPLARGHCQWDRGLPGVEQLGRLVSVEGRVTRVGAPCLVEAHTSWRCSGCQGEQLLPHNPLQPQAKPLVCEGLVDGRLCGGIKFTRQASSARSASCLDWQEVRLQEATGHLGLGAMPRSLPVLLAHDLVDRLLPGQLAVVTGRLAVRWKPFKLGAPVEGETVLIAEGLDDNNFRSNSHSTSPLTEWQMSQWWTQARQRGQELQARNLLVSQLAPRLHGLHWTKLACLLTVIGGGHGPAVEGGASEAKAGLEGDAEGGGGERHEAEGGNRSLGHLLLIGDPGTAKSRLLRAVADCLQRPGGTGIRAIRCSGSGTTAAGLTVAAVRDPQLGGWSLEPGALVLADGGVCCLDELLSLRPTDLTALHEALEQQRVSVAKAGLVMQLPCRCSLLATAASLKQQQSGPVNTLTALASPLLSRFDLILPLCDRHDATLDAQIAAAVLEGRGEGGIQSSVASLPASFKLADYVELLRQRVPTPPLSPEAKTALLAYYRLQRSADIRDAARTTLRLLQSLQRLAVAHARLLFHERVELLDAMVAICLMECSLWSSTGSRLLGNLLPNLMGEAAADPAIEMASLQARLLPALGLEHEQLAHS